MTINTILGGHELIGHDLRVDGLEMFLLTQKELHPSVCCCSKLFFFKFKIHQLHYLQFLGLEDVPPFQMAKKI